MQCSRCKFDVASFNPVSGWGVKFSKNDKGHDVCEWCVALNSDGTAKEKKTFNKLSPEEKKERLRLMAEGRKRAREAKQQAKKVKVIDKGKDGRSSWYGKLSAEEKAAMTAKKVAGKKLKRLDTMPREGV